MTWESAIAAVLSVLYLVLYPLVYVLWWILNLLHLLVTPFMSLGLSAFHLALLPLRILVRFEALFIFLAAAVLIGAISGFVLHCTCTLLVDYLPSYLLGSLRTPSTLRGQPSERNRKSKNKPESQKSLGTSSYKDPLSSSAYPDRWDSGPLSSTILEEEESSQESGGGPFGYGYQEDEKYITGGH